MKNYKKFLNSLNDVSHIKKIKLYNQEYNLVGTILQQKGSQGSIRIYSYLFETFGEINPDAAAEGLDIYSEYTDQSS